MRITRSQLKKIIKEEMTRLLKEEVTFEGEEGPWSFEWAPNEQAWQLQNKGTVVAAGTSGGSSASPDFVGPKGTNLIDAIDAYRSKESDNWTYGGGPKTTELPENAAEGWSIEFDSLEEEDPQWLNQAVSDATQEMRDRWSS
jgi:hypothetical protein